MLLSGRGDNPIGPKRTSQFVFLSGGGEYKCGQQLVSVVKKSSTSVINGKPALNLSANSRHASDDPWASE